MWRGRCAGRPSARRGRDAPPVPLVVYALGLSPLPLGFLSLLALPLGLLDLPALPRGLLRNASPVGGEAHEAILDAPGHAVLVADIVSEEGSRVRVVAVVLDVQVLVEVTNPNPTPTLSFVFCL